METQQVEVRVQLITSPLTENQFSVTKIPGMIYDHFAQLYGKQDEKTSTYGNQSTRWQALRTDKDAVIMLHSEEPDGDAIQTKFALLTWYPHTGQFRESYEFEINGEISSGSWEYGVGNKYSEALTFCTNTGKAVKLYAKHPITQYIALALTKAQKLARLPNVVSQKFVDHVPKPPR